MAGRAFDERYDPRFQRGFEGGSDASGGEAAQLASGGADLRNDTPAAPREAPSVGPNSTSGLNPRVESDASGVSAPEYGTGSGAEARPGEPVGLEAPEAPGETVLARRWLWAAFGICAFAVGLAVAWLWSGFTDPRYFGGGYATRTGWDDLRWLGAAALIDVGTIGAAAVAIWLGMRQAARPGREPLLRLPAVIGLMVGVGAAVLVVLWAGSGPTQSVLWTGDPALMDEEQRTELALAQLRSALGGPAVRAGLVALLGIVLVGARAAMGRERPAPEASGPTG